MKKLLFLIATLWAFSSYSQSIGYLRYDTVKIMKQGGAGELMLINATKDTLGFLANVSGGKTVFKRVRKLNDSTLIFNFDTLSLRGNGGAGTVTSLTFTSPLTGGTITTSGTVGLAGLTGLGSANQLVGMNNAATAFEYKTVSTSGTAVANDVGVTLSGANALVINLPTASSTVRGVLSTSDWSTFNAKQPAGSYITALTTDVVATGPGSVVATIQPDVVTYAKMQNISATSRIMGRITAGAGDMEELTGTQATTLLDNFTSTLKGLAPLSGGGTSNFLRADGTWAAPAGTTFTGANNGDTLISGNVGLGSMLIRNTRIDAKYTNDFEVINADSMYFLSLNSTDPDYSSYLRLGRRSGVSIYANDAAASSEIKLSPEGQINLIGNVKVGTTAVHASAVMDIQATSVGFLLPRMTGSQSNAISAPAQGLLTYRTDASAGAEGLYGYIASGWKRFLTSADSTTLAASTPISSLTAAIATNTINNAAYAQEWQWNILGEGLGLSIASNSTTASGSGQVLFQVALSGANSNSGETSYASKFFNSHTGTGAINVAGYFTANGGAANYAIIVPPTSGYVGIGTSTPSSILHLVSTSLGVSRDETKAFSIENTTAAAAGAQQRSPELILRGRGWKTNATAASQDVGFAMSSMPVQGAAEPTGYLRYEAIVNGSAKMVFGIGDEGEIYASGAVGNANDILYSGGAGAAAFWGAAAVAGANTALSNLASVAINAALVLGTSDAFALGSTTKQWSDLFLAVGGVINWDNGDATITQTGNDVLLTGATFTSNQNALGSTPADGILISNTTAAAAAAQQFSPALHFVGKGWKTNATAASQDVSFRAYVTPVQGEVNPTGYLGFGSSINGAAYTNDQLVLSSAGFVGIGIATPVDILHLHKSSAPSFRLTDGTSGTSTGDGFDITYSAGSAYIVNRENGGLSFYTNGAEYFTVSSAGGITMANLAGAGSRAVLADASGNLSAPVSDRSVKFNISPLENGIEKLMQLNPVTFEYINGWKNYGEGTQIGFIAQEVEQVLPNSVFTTASTGKKGYNSNDIIPLLVKSVQELSARVEYLEEQLKNKKD